MKTLLLLLNVLLLLAGNTHVVMSFATTKGTSHFVSMTVTSSTMECVSVSSSSSSHNTISSSTPARRLAPRRQLAFVGTMLGRLASGALQRICIQDSMPLTSNFPSKLLHALLLMGVFEAMIPDNE